MNFITSLKRYGVVYVCVFFILISLFHIFLAEEFCDKSTDGQCNPPASSTRQQKYTSTNMSEMKAIRVEEFGDESKLKLTSIALPKPDANQVLIKVEAIGVNPVEVMIRMGMFGDMVKAPYTPGTDIAGVIEAVGEKVTKFKKGDRVYAIKADSGAYAEYCTSPSEYVSPLHESLSFSQGATIGVPYCVAYKGLFIRANSKKGETVLIHGASGGVGIASVQMAKANGLTVIGTAGSKKGLELVKSMGADFVFNHKEEGYMAKIKESTGGKGVNVILEMAANKNLMADLGILASRGRIVVIGNKGPFEGQFDAGLTMGTEANIMGLVVQVSTPEEYKEMLAAINKGQGHWVKPHVGKEYSFDQVAQAHKDVWSGSNTAGKLVLKPKL